MPDNDLENYSDDELRNAWRAARRNNERTRDAIRREMKRRRRELRDRVRAQLMYMEWRATPTIEQLRAALKALTHEEPVGK